MRKMLYQLMAMALFVISLAQVNVASGSLGYQPKVPKSLR